MRFFFKPLLLMLLSIPGFAQVTAPQIPLTGNIGAGGVFPLLNSGTIAFADANHTMAYPEMSASFIKLTSSVSLTATRNLVAPLTRGFQFTVENATTGGQAIQVIASSGTGVTIANGTAVTVFCDGTNYVTTPAGTGNTTSSGMVNGNLPVATGANSLGDSGVGITTGGSSHGISFPASSAPVTPVAATAIYESDSAGNAAISENGGAASRPCTATNGVCAGGGTFPSTPKLIGGTGTANVGQVGTPAQMGVTLSDTTNGNQLETDANPTSTIGIDNNIQGVGAGPNLTKGASSPNVGGQYDVVIGQGAAAAATTMRESTIIGAEACPSLTGNSSGASSEDTVVMCEGSHAGTALTSTPSAGGTPAALDCGLWGQKAGAGLTGCTDDLFMGNHTGVGTFNVTSTVNSTVVGEWAGSPYGANTTFLRVNFFGSFAGDLFGGSQVVDDTAVGANTFSSLHPTGVNGNGNNVVGNNGMGNCTICGLNDGEGLNVFSGGAANFTGIHNIAFNNTGTLAGPVVGAGVALTSGTFNAIFWSAGPTSGSFNFLADPNAATGTGSNNIIVGQSAGADLGSNQSDTVSIGNGSAAGVTGCEALGVNAQCEASGSQAIGNAAGTSSAATNGVAEGASASVGSADGVAIGEESVSTEASFGHTVAVGSRASATGVASTCIGYNTQCPNSESTALGYASQAQQADSIAIGDQALSTASGAVEIGIGTNATANTMAYKGKTVSDSSGNLYDPAIGSSTSLLCTTTGGQLTNSGCTTAPLLLIPASWNIQSTLFALSSMLGNVTYSPYTGSNQGPMIARLSGTISCTVAPVIVLMDLGTSPSTVYGSATPLASLTTGTSDGVYVQSAVPALTTGHYYGVAFSAGTCVTAPTFDITVNQQW